MGGQAANWLPTAHQPASQPGKPLGYSTNAGKTRIVQALLELVWAAASIKQRHELMSTGLKVASNKQFSEFT